MPIWAVAACCTAAATLAPTVGPLLMSRGRWWVRLPRTALWVWHGLFAGGIAVAAASAVVLISTLSQGGPLLGDRPSTTSTAAVLAAQSIVTAVVVGGLAALLGHLEKVLRGVHDGRQAMQHLISAYGVPHADLSTSRCAVVVLPATGPIACCLSHGGVATVCVSERLLAGLDPLALQALLVHEQGHARQRHEHFVVAARLAARWTPWLPGARKLSHMTSLLIELAADDHARRLVGAVATTSALQHLERHGAGPSVTLRRERLQQLVH